MEAETKQKLEKVLDKLVLDKTKQISLIINRLEREIQGHPPLEFELQKQPFSGFLDIKVNYFVTFQNKGKKGSIKYVFTNELDNR